MNVTKILNRYDYYMKKYDFMQLKQIKQEMENNNQDNSEDYTALLEAMSMKYEMIHG